MALSLSANFTHQVNLVLPLAPAPPVPSNTTGLAVRVASLLAGTLGTLTASGAAGSLAWTMTNAPAFVTMSQDPTNTITTIAFAAAVPNPNPYEFWITVTDGVTTLNFPFLLEVKPPLSIQANASNPVVSGATLTVPSYDDTVQDIVIQGVGLAGQTPVPDVNFVLPSGGLGSFPGLNWVTSNENQLILRVADPRFTPTRDLAGGLKLYTTSPEQVTLTVAAYQPGAFYDQPNRAFVQPFTLQSLTAKQGTLDYGLGVFYDTVAGTLKFDAHNAVDVLQGLLQKNNAPVHLPFQFAWTPSAGLTLSSGGGAGNDFAYYSINSLNVSATVTLTIQDALANNLAVTTIGPFNVSNAGASWLGSNAIKVATSSTIVGGLPDFVQGYIGDVIPIVVSQESTTSPAFNPAENINLIFTVVPASGLEPAIPNPAPVTINTGSPTTTVHITIPPGAAIGEKWVLQIAANNGATRTGFAEVLIESNGSSPLLITTDGVPAHLPPVSIASNTGSVITPISLVAINNNPNSVNYHQPVANVTYELVGAPDGLFIQNTGGNFALVGNALQPGSYTFAIDASASGFARSYSANITLTVTTVAVPLQITSVSSSASLIPNNTPFNVLWSYSGGGNTDPHFTLTLAQQPTPTSFPSVAGTGSIVINQNGTCVYDIYGTSFYGTAYGIPIIVLSSSVAQGAQLLPAPTIGIIDQNNDLTVNWQPAQFGGAYNIYAGWNIQTTLLPAPPNVAQTIFKPSSPLNAGETVSARIFTETLTAGNFLLNMQAISNNHALALDSPYWDNPHQFPTALTATSVTLSATSLELGQPLTLTLSSNYSGADTWQVFWPDNTNTGALPLSSAVVGKVFNTPGPQNITVQVENDFSTATPPVKLRRTLVVPVFVVNQQYNPQAAAQGALTGTLGIGGQQLFEIVNATTGLAVPQPYEMIARTLVRDMQTNEIKELIATSRFSNASSLLGTMALDVFPLKGRPQAKELIDPYTLMPNPLSSSVPVSITTSTQNFPALIVGKPMPEFQLQAQGGNTPYLWSSNDLPAGVHLSTSGALTGTPLSLGVFSVNFAVQDSSVPFYVDETTISVVVQTDLLITTPVSGAGAPPNAQVGTQYQFQMSNTGGLAPYTWSIAAGAFPLGISINPNTGLLSGYPVTYNSTTDFTKKFTATVQVQDAIGAINTQTYTITLSAATLSFSPAVNQPSIFADNQFKLTIPIFGGQSPYTLLGFTETPPAVVGSGLAVVNPVQIEVVAGIVPPTLTILTPDQEIFPDPYPQSISVSLTASGGVPSNAGLPVGTGYKFFIDPTATSTLPGAIVYGDLLVGTPAADSDPANPFTAVVKCIDSAGHSTSKTLSIAVQQQAPPAASVPFIVLPSTINAVTPSNPATWLISPLPSGFPNAARNNAYSPGGANTYYAVVLYKNTLPTPTPVLSGVSLPGPDVTFECPFGPILAPYLGDLPPGMSAVSGNTIAGTGADAVVLLTGSPTGVASIDGGYSFETEFANITSPTATLVKAVSRQSIVVMEPPASGTTPVVVITSIEGIHIDLNTVVANSAGTYSWAFPLIAEGGTRVYTFNILSGSTLPGVVLTTVNGQPAFASATTITGSYNVIVTATDSGSTTSAPVTIPVQIGQSTTQPIHILDNTMPASLFANNPIPAQTYYVDSDLVANWTATGLPAGVTLSTAPGTRVYLQGTPTAAGVFTVNITATSVSFGTTATQSFPLTINAQTAQIIAPNAPPHSPGTAIVGTQYRVINNNVLLSVQYTGYQPTSPNLPTLFNTVVGNQIGAPGLLIGGQTSTGIRSVTPSGFIMDYDYIPTVSGTDSITLQYTNIGPILDSLTINDVYATLNAIGTTVSQTVSEYATTGTFPLPITVSGGNGSYVYNVSTSDARFTVINNNTASAQIQISVNAFTPGTTVSAQIAVTVSDTEGSPQMASASGTLTITIRQETYITVLYNNQTFPAPVITTPGVYSLVMPTNGVTVQLAHLPVTYNVTNITLPAGLLSSGVGQNVQILPSQRVIAFNSGSPATVFDVDGHLNSAGPFVVPTLANPTAGTYVIAVTYQVIDNNGITSSGTANVSVIIS
jgi:hypothetical protein